VAQARITKRTVDALKAKQRDVFLWDTDLRGFGVKCTPLGRRVFLVQYRPLGGRRSVTKRLTLGQYGQLTPEQARQAARAVLAEVAGGADPGIDRGARRQALTVTEAATLFLEEVDAKKKARTAYEYRRLMEGEIVPALRTIKVKDVARAQVSRIHHGGRDRPYAANRILALASVFFSWCERHGHREPGTNPCRGIERYREEARERFLTADELGRLGATLTKAEREGLPPAQKHRQKPRSPATAKHRPKGADTPRPANPFAVAAIRFLVLSGFREQEALSLRWDAIDFTRGMVTLADSKTGKSVRHVGAPALELVASLPREDGNPHVFPGRTPGSPLIEIKRVWEAVRETASLSDVRLHDLRHSFASVAASGGASLPLVGALLGHKNVATTQRYAHLADDPRKHVADSTASTVAAALSGPRTARAIALENRSVNKSTRG
jgi:integrase